MLNKMTLLLLSSSLTPVNFGHRVNFVSILKFSTMTN